MNLVILLLDCFVYFSTLSCLNKEVKMISVLPTKRISRNILIAVLVVIACLSSIITTKAVHAAGNNILPTNPNINYVGRWDTSSSTVYTSYWPGAYFKTAFTGTTAKIKLAHAANIYVLIDNGKDTFYANATGTVNLTPTPLAAGTHSLRVAAYSEHDDIAFQGLVLDAAAKTVATPIPSQFIEFVGDSVTAGATDTKHALSDYAWLIGEQLGVRHTQIAQGGICLTDKVQCGSPNAIGMSRAYFKLQTVYFPNSPDWGFSSYRPNIVVINLGTNDEGYHVSDATFESTYITFLKNIHAKLPNTRIVVLRTFRGNEAAPTLAAVQAIKAAGNNYVRYIDTTGWLIASDYNAGPHPSDAGHVKVANKLGPILAQILGLTWKNI
jgi:GDSL-like Lipase/Acylhydrolase family/Carbohydrate esterase 2 N-terminal